MATKIKKIKNDSDIPVAYVGKGGMVPTGWSAWAFAPNKAHEFGWDVTTIKGEQVLFTKAGAFNIWDDGKYNIKYQKPEGDEAVLVHIDFKPAMNIEIQIASNGHLKGTQV